ncbi:MAG: efflux RND transporter permease subunit, partial [Bdellovibrionota bacterium]
LLLVPAAFVPGTFLPPQEAGEFTVAIDMPPGTSLDATNRAAEQIGKVLSTHKEVELTTLTVGSGREGEPNKADFYVKMVSRDKRPGVTTIAFKSQLREELKPFAAMNPKVKDYDPIGGGQRPFTLLISGTDQKQLETVSLKVLDALKKDTSLTDVDVDFRPGKPEFQVVPDKSRALLLGTSTGMIGAELRAQIEGIVPAKFRQNGVEYDVRIRLQDDQRNLQEGFSRTFVPNLNNSLVRLSDVAQGIATDGPSKISRMNRERVVQITADVAAKGAGLEGAVGNVKKLLGPGGTLELPKGTNYYFIGQAENMAEMQESMQLAMMAGVVFIFLVLASLYESFVTPFTIMLAMPLAIGGSFVALWITGESLNLFSMIGFVMLMGVAVKNSILLVDYANQMKAKGHTRTESIIIAGKTRLRPILMTTMALVAGAIPIAVGFNEASKQRTSMGVVIIGGLISSTLLTLVVIPATYAFVDRFREWSANLMADLFMSKEGRDGVATVPLPPKGGAADRYAPSSPHSPKDS